MAPLWMMMIWSARRRERHLQECRIIPHSQTDSLHTQSIIIVIIIIIIKIIGSSNTLKGTLSTPIGFYPIHPSSMIHHRQPTDVLCNFSMFGVEKILCFKEYSNFELHFDHIMYQWGLCEPFEIKLPPYKQNHSFPANQIENVTLLTCFR